EQFAAGKIVLVFDGGDVGSLIIFGVRLLRALGREEGVLIVQIVDQETGGENVAAGDVGLEFGQIADAERVIVIGTGGKLGIDSVVVFALETVVEPRLSLLNRPREGEARKELVEAPSMLVDEGRDEVAGPEAEVVVTDAGVEQQQAARPFAGFGGFA